jgi:glycosyltransferase involved in cell wall biosynthesis
VIASNLGSLAEVVDDEVGWRAAPADTGVLRAAMEYVFHDPDATRARGASARERYEQRFAPTIVMDQLERIYADVTG